MMGALSFLFKKKDSEDKTTIESTIAKALVW